MDLLRIVWCVVLMVTWVFVAYGIVVASIVAGVLMEAPSYMLTGEVHLPAVALWSLWATTVAGVIFCGRRACRRFRELLVLGW